MVWLHKPNGLLQSSQLLGRFALQLLHIYTSFLVDSKSPEADDLVGQGIST